MSYYHALQPPARLRHLYLCPARSHPRSPSDPAFGLRAPGATVANMVNGGGVFSMLNVVFIVAISSVTQVFSKHASASTYVRDGR